MVEKVLLEIEARLTGERGKNGADMVVLIIELRN